MSPGTAYVLLHHYMGDVDGSVGAWGYARGGMGAITQALASSFQAAGGTIRTDSEVASVKVRGGRSEGVRPRRGEEVRARLVLSNADVKTHLPEARRRKGIAAAVPRPRPPFQDARLLRQGEHRPRRHADFPALPSGSTAVKGDLHFTDTVERIERAYDDWKAGRWSADPFLDAMIPTTLDPTLAAPGKHFMSCFVQYCPPKVEGRDCGPTPDPRRLRRDGGEPDRGLFPGSRPLSAIWRCARLASWRRKSASRGNISRASSPSTSFCSTARCRLRAISHADQGPLSVRLVHPSGGGVMGAPATTPRRSPARPQALPPTHEPGP